MKTTLVITTRNEINGVTKLVPRIPLDKFDEILVIDLNSEDGTLDFFQDKGFKIINQTEPGRGNAVRLAASVATGDALVFFAPDGNEDPDDLIKLRDLIIEGNDMAIASRFLPGARNEEDAFIFKPRAWANKFFTFLVKIIWGGTISDTINGYRSIRKDKLIELNTDESGFAIEFQMSIRALKLGYKVAEFPTTEGDRIGGHSTAYTIPTGLRVLHTLGKEILIGKNFWSKMRIVEQVKPSDSRAIWEIRYHPLVNQQSSNTQEVDFAAHDQWFQEKYFGQSGNKCFVLKVAGQVIGYCRFDLDEAGNFNVSIAIHPNYQGRGFGKLLLSESLRQLPSDQKIVAAIKRNNDKSLKLFQDCGFIIHKEDPGYFLLNRS